MFVFLVMSLLLHEVLCSLQLAVAFLVWAL